MSRILVRWLLGLMVTLCALGVLLLLALLVMGSAEEFPTQEQDEKVRIAAGLLLVVLAAAGGLSLRALKRMKP